jgi:formate-dependent nitrite reductase cytochrome c552 subunit
MADNKVKVSMFLAAPIAQAVKIRAARDSTGVSETISNMFQCAHCRETITDEFIIGKPTQIAPNRYAVFFHKNRKECAEASGTEIRFFMKCPNCHEHPMQTFDPLTLKKLIHAKTV